MANNSKKTKKSENNTKNAKKSENSIKNAKKSIDDWLSEHEYAKSLVAMLVSLALFALNMGIATLAGSMPLFFVLPLLILTGMGLYEQGRLSKGTIFAILVIIVIIIDIVVMIFLADQGRIHWPS